jgi:hypothetical protein
MAAFFFPQPTLGSFEVHQVATHPLSSNAPSNAVPVKMLGDGNCIFQSASFLAHVAVMTELGDNVEFYVNFSLTSPVNLVVTESVLCLCYPRPLVMEFIITEASPFSALFTH